MPALDWIGKQAVVNHHQEVPYHLLRNVPELGGLWAERSGAKGLFVMPNCTDRAAINAAINSPKP